jgi:hypothetical protein
VRTSITGAFCGTSMVIQGGFQRLCTAPADQDCYCLHPSATQSYGSQLSVWPSTSNPSRSRS